MAAENFSRLAPFVREYIYEKKWDALNAIQDRAIGAILDGTGHILIASGTASGKTEACFFPVISLLAGKAPPAPSVAVLYVGPLKALINDQAERLGEILSRAAVPLWRWHGDVSGAHKNKLLENPSGILQITPESLEALLLRRPDKIKPLFQGLSFIIIDEVHAFMGTDRGAQLLCQMGRIRAAAGSVPRRIGLSATLGDYTQALRWLGAGSAGETTLIRGGETKKRFRVAVDYFRKDGPVKPGPRRGKSPGVRADSAESAYYRELYRQSRNIPPRGDESRANRAEANRERAGRAGKCVIFTNSRLEAEETIARLREMAAKRREGNVFRIHHGSVSRMFRIEAEDELREKEGPLVVAATATLEMGIDIGNLDRIIQIGPPHGVASFLQRLGRSGRRKDSAEIYFTALERGDDDDGLPWTLLRTIAVIQLYLEEKWIEDSPSRPLPYSLLCHQTFAILASLGEQEPAELARRVLSLPPFGEIPAEDFRELLLHLIGGGYIQKIEGKNLIIGLEAEEIVNDFSFYAVFPDEEAFRVIFGGRELGTVHFPHPRGSNLALAGRYWRVEEVDRGHREIFVVPGESGEERIWRGGGAELHRRIPERMRAVLAEERIYPYLSGRARDRLLEARRYARKTGLVEKNFIPDG
ncbi:MAG: DEAD/DEAH box helicase, partial [Spirochaetaceae bacterium]|nr:DEAD/DEAH box helicase [Spirochaetaceae bacterium]